MTVYTSNIVKATIRSDAWTPETISFSYHATIEWNERKH